MNRKLEKLLVICALTTCPMFFSAGSIVAQNNRSAAGLLEKKETKRLTAGIDKSAIKREMSAVDSIMIALQLEDEEEEFPANDLYSSWNSERVNPYKAEDIQIPDSFRIDVSSFIMPFEGKITSRFGPRRRRFHYGTDVKVQVGDTIRAAFDGKVRVMNFQRKGYGYYMVLRHSNGLETVYGHLSEFLLNQDAIVKAGDPIALGGNTGRSTGPHLHFEMRFLGQPINPETIVDFDNYSTFSDSYVFKKNESSPVYRDNKYTGKDRKDRIVYHRVRSGDTLGEIASRYRVSVSKLCKLNNVRPTTTLKIGRAIRCS